MSWCLCTLHTPTPLSVCVSRSGCDSQQLTSSLHSSIHLMVSVTLCDLLVGKLWFSVCSLYACLSLPVFLFPVLFCSPPLLCPVWLHTCCTLIGFTWSLFACSFLKEGGATWGRVWVWGVLTRTPVSSPPPSVRSQLYHLGILETVQVSSLPLSLPGDRGNSFLPGNFNCCFGFGLIHVAEYSHLSPTHTDTQLQH